MSMVAVKYLQGLFSIADTNGDGVLQPTELVKLLSMCGFELSSTQILDVMTEADVNGDGVIDYEELVPVAASLLKVVKDGKGSSDAVTPKYAWSDVPAEELDAYLRKLFAIADENGDGVLQPQEYVKLMRLSGLGFPDELILQGFTEADTNQDGVIQYEELVEAFNKD